ncbi:unnamed protein product, partial [Allacma fusca]
DPAKSKGQFVDSPALFLNAVLGAPGPEEGSLEVPEAKEGLRCVLGYQWNGVLCVHPVCALRFYWNGLACVPIEGANCFTGMGPPAFVILGYIHASLVDTGMAAHARFFEDFLHLDPRGFCQTTAILFSSFCNIYF